MGPADAGGDRSGFTQVGLRLVSSRTPARRPPVVHIRARRFRPHPCDALHRSTTSRTIRQVAVEKSVRALFVEDGKRSELNHQLSGVGAGEVLLKELWHNVIKCSAQNAPRQAEMRDFITSETMPDGRSMQHTFSSASRQSRCCDAGIIRPLVSLVGTQAWAVSMFPAGRSGGRGERHGLIVKSAVLESAMAARTCSMNADRDGVRCRRIRNRSIRRTRSAITQRKARSIRSTLAAQQTVPRFVEQRRFIS